MFHKHEHLVLMLRYSFVMKIEVFLPLTLKL